MPRLAHSAVDRCTHALLILVLASLVLALGAASAPSKPKRGVDAKVARKTLTVVGNDRANKITLRLKRRKRNTLEVDTGGSRKAEFRFNRRRFKKIVVRGRRGNDSVVIDERAGAFTTTERTTVDGGAGKDKFAGGRGRETFNGGAGNDSTDAGGGADTLRLGAGNDVLRSTPGDGSDRVRGDGGGDRITFDGSGGDERLSASPADGGRLRLARSTDGASLVVNGVETIDLNPRGGADGVTVGDPGGTGATRIDVDLGGAPRGSPDGQSDELTFAGGAGNNVYALTGGSGGLTVAGTVANTTRGADAGDSLKVDGGAGNDRIDASGLPAELFPLTLRGGEGSDNLTGHPGADSLIGEPGDDTVALGAGDDVFTSNAGDGNDAVEGQDGSDRLVVNGSDGVDNLSAAGDAGRVRVLRDGGPAVDADGSETLSVHPRGGGDSATVGNLTGTDVGRADVDLGGDGHADNAGVHGTAGDDNLVPTKSAQAAEVAGLPYAVNVTSADGATDRLSVDALEGVDTVDASGTPAEGLALTLAGGEQADVVSGGAGDDTLLGGGGDDQVSGLGGADRMIWNPGDGTDVNEGGDGDDTSEVNGGDEAEIFTVTANGTRVRFDRLDPAPFALDIGTTENLVSNLNGGNDSFSTTGNLAALIKIDTDGGAGEDTVLGSNGADVLQGGDDDDFVDGQQGNDEASLGGGDDVFQWDPGDGSDTLEGQAGSDTMLFNGSGANEIFEASANGGRLRFTRNVGNIVMDAGGVEVVDLNALGGADTLTVNDLAGTGVAEVRNDLAGTLNGNTGDGQADTVIVNGTNGADGVDVLGAGTSASVDGLPARVDITNSEGTNDSLVVNGLAQSDDVTATTLPAGVIRFTVDGGGANDSLRGSQAADVFLGGDGDDFIFGDNGNDIAFLGANDDVFQWEPGDGSDTLEGQDGSDTMRFFGSGASENIDVSANGARVRFFRDVANVTMDLDDLENADFRALGGADNIVAGDLNGTDMTNIDLDLRGPSGGGDGAADTVTANGTQGADVFGAAGDAGGVHVFGLQATIDISQQEQANDRLTLNALGGEDVVDATSLEADGIQLTMNGGLGADVFLGSEGDDLINGGDGNDTALMGAGNDTFTWNPGDDNDTLEGQAGSDGMLFNGANVAENITVSANGGRVLFFRDVANVTMDLNDVETIDFNALGGADTITVGDLSGTDVTSTELDLAAVGGGGDAAADNVIVNGTNGDDVAVLSGSAAGVTVAGLATQVSITGAEAANDRLTVNALVGDDVIEASNVASGAIALTFNGGNDEDVLIGGAGNDILNGDDGDDVLIGGPGTDTLNGGNGDDVEIQD
jgi:Ca2+-binding RTX toxin-like protein